MICVHIISEDRTGGGLENVIQKSVQANRALLGKAPLRFPLKGNVDGASQLLAQCERYEFFRFKYPQRFDHVFYVMDARNVWDPLKPLGIKAPQPPLSKSLPLLIAAVKAGMTLKAQGTRSHEAWADISSGFHPHVLVWERESLLLPVLDKLELGESITDVYGEKQAYETVSLRMRQARQGRKYDKAIHGPQYLDKIAQDSGLRATVLASNPSLRALVDEMSAL